MSRKSIGYHTRLSTNQSQKLTGGSFGGSVDMDTVNRLVKHFFDVIVKDSGHAVFVDKEGREVSLYFTIDPQTTDKGIAAMKVYYAKRRVQIEEEVAKERRAKEEIEDILEGLSYEEIIRRLKGEQ